MSDRYARLAAAVRVIHPFPAAAVVITSLLLILVAHRGSPGPAFLLRAGTVVLLSQIAAGALNDYLDRGADARLQPDKPIPAGLVAPATALLLTIGSLLLIVPMGLSFGPISLGLVSLGTGSALAYDLWLKPTAFSFVSYIVSFLTLLTWIWHIAGRFSPWLLPIYPAAALLLVAAHLAQSFPDIEADRTIGRRGLAVVLGPRRTPRVILALYASVAIGGLVLSLLARSVIGVALVLASLGLLLPTWRLAGEGLVRRDRRVQMFRLIVAGICLQGLGSLVSVMALA